MNPSLRIRPTDALVCEPLAHEHLREWSARGCFRDPEVVALLGDYDEACGDDEDAAQYLTTLPNADNPRSRAWGIYARHTFASPMAILVAEHYLEPGPGQEQKRPARSWEDTVDIVGVPVLVVEPHWRGEGYGTRILAALLDAESQDLRPRHDPFAAAPLPVPDTAESVEAYALPGRGGAKALAAAGYELDRGYGADEHGYERWRGQRSRGV